MNGRHGGHGGIAAAADICNDLPHAQRDALVVLQRQGRVVALRQNHIHRSVVPLLAQGSDQGPQLVIQSHIPAHVEVVQDFGYGSLLILGGVVAQQLQKICQLL